MVLVGFITVTLPIAALRFLCIFSASNARSIQSMAVSFILAVTVSWAKSNPFLRSLHRSSSIKHQVILHVKTGLSPLRRLASGLSPVNKTTTGTAVAMVATATRLRIVQPLLKLSKICGNDRKIRLWTRRKLMSCTSPLSTGPTERRKKEHS
jgi:hypothetical protein